MTSCLKISGPHYFYFCKPSHNFCTSFLRALFVCLFVAAHVTEQKLLTPNNKQKCKHFFIHKVLMATERQGLLMIECDIHKNEDFSTESLGHLPHNTTFDNY